MARTSHNLAKVSLSILPFITRAEREASEQNEMDQQLRSERKSAVEEYFRPKVEEYQQTSGYLQEELTRNGYDFLAASESDHRALVHQNQILTSLQRDTAPKLATLRSYHSLPPVIISKESHVRICHSRE